MKMRSLGTYIAREKGSSDEEDSISEDEIKEGYTKPNNSIVKNNSKQLEPHISDDEDTSVLENKSKRLKPYSSIVEDSIGTNKSQQPEPHISDEEDDLFISNSNSLDSIQGSLDSFQVSSSNVFTDLPAPVSHNLNLLSSISSLGTKGKSQASVKITIPSLDEFDDVEDLNEPKKTKIQASLKGSGLFSLLPKPRNEFLATPRQIPSSSTSTTKVNSIQHNITLSKSLVPRQVSNKINKSIKPTNGIINYESGDSDDENDNFEETAGDFFTIPDKVEKIDEIVTDKNIEEYLKPIIPEKEKSKTPSRDSYKLKTNEIVEPCIETNRNEYYYQEQITNYGPSLEEPIELNDDVIRKLGGRKRKGEDLELIEVDGRSLVPDSNEWMKQLSQETTYKPSTRKGEGPTSQQKRKHQITYLAHQAKANELDLKNQWAQNRQSKRQTQSKYGF